VKKPATAKRKTGSRAKAAGTSARARAPRKPRQRASTAAAAARAAPDRSRSIRSKLKLAAPARAYSQEERTSLLLLLAPFALMAVAVAAVQFLSPFEALRRQLAQLPPVPLAEAWATSPALADREPAEVATMSPSLAVLPTAPVRDAVRMIGAAAPLAAQPPGQSIPTRVARLGHPDRCVASAPKAPQRVPAAASNPYVFGDMLARAARAQTRDLVVYKDDYREIGFPMGDVPRFYGVCTDVVIRAYRALGIDLQVLVHQARIGTGDTSIDHRRTKTLRRFFERYGESLPVTDFVEDYQPGDIVTYYRAGGRTSQTHIAIVSDVMAPSGRPMIVHNRGWGPQLEDALFASDITGHYRFTHVTPAEQASAPQSTSGPTLR
jgi:uncharacterized protein YijF (DUF1287 family)